MMGYIVGKVEGQGEHWHGHVTAVTVAPDFRCAEAGERLRTECLRVMSGPERCDDQAPYAAVDSCGHSQTRRTSLCRCLPHCAHTSRACAKYDTHVCRSRRQGLARKFMDLLEEVTEKVHDGYFVDLFVRVSNTSAITMYKKVQELAFAYFHHGSNTEERLGLVGA